MSERDTPGIPDDEPIVVRPRPGTETDEPTVLLVPPPNPAPAPAATAPVSEPEPRAEADPGAEPTVAMSRAALRAVTPQTRATGPEVATGRDVGEATVRLSAIAPLAPVRPEAVDTEPGHSGPVGPDPVRGQPTRVEPTGTQTSRMEPVRAEPVRAEPVDAEFVGAEPLDAEPDTGQVGSTAAVERPAAARATTADPAPALVDPAPAAADAGAPDGDVSVAVPPKETAATAKPQVAPWRRLSSAGALIWVLIALFGFTLVVQLRSSDTDQGLAATRQEDLVAILSDLEARETRLNSEIAGLEESQRGLTSGVEGKQAALAEAERRANELGLLAGTLAGRGPGLEISITAGGVPIKASAILNTVQELRGSGGEVMQLAGSDGTAVRVIASSSFVDADGGVAVDGTRLTSPYLLTVIGAPQTMDTALRIPGGVVASVGKDGGTVNPLQRKTVEVTAVREASNLQYARPVS